MKLEIIKLHITTLRKRLDNINNIYKMVFGCNVNFDSIGLVRHINNNRR